MRFEATSLAGAYHIRPDLRRDERGFFARAWCAAEMAERGLAATIAQINMAHSARRGTLRGLHFQLPPHSECKLIRCTRGSVYNVIVDLRPDSATFGQWFAAELSVDNQAMVYSPEGFANGYQTLSDDAEIVYSTTRPYAPGHARGVRYDDPLLAIRWPLPVESISPQDQAWPDLTRATWTDPVFAAVGAGGRP